MAGRMRLRGVGEKKATDREDSFPEIENDAMVITGSNQRDQMSEVVEHGENSPVHSHNRHSLDGDRLNIAVLVFLYVLQGIPLGLAGSIPMVLQNKKISYKEQAVFSFVFWPFSLKLLWAPIVDSVYVKRFGRRKSWLVPVQYVIGIFMLLFSMYADDLLETEIPKVLTLTAVFFTFNFLAATQDIAVDGWALTMLRKANVGYASTCNSVGQTAGYFLGNVVFLALNSADFCNSYLRSSPEKIGIVTLSSFMFFWGMIFIVTTSLVCLFKNEKVEPRSSDDFGIVETYKQLLKIVQLPAVMTFAVILLTIKVGFAAADGITGLKLVEAGVRRETLALLAVPLVPVQIVLPLLISRYTAGPRPLDVFRKAFPFRLAFGIVFALVVYWTRTVRPAEGQEFPMYYYGIILFIYILHQVTLYTMFVSIMAFNAKVSDPAIGGTYMTLLNTVSNLGGNWPVTLALWSIDSLTWKSCSGALNGADCNSVTLAQACQKAGGSCQISIDGYYVESVICVVLGFIWLLWRRKTLTYLQNLSSSAWKVID